MIAVYAAITVTALFAAIGAATASESTPLAVSGMHLTRIQERELYFDLNTGGSSEVAPPGFMAKVGETVPKNINIVPLPTRAITRVPAVRDCDYAILYYFAMATNEVLLVDPHSRKIVDIITP